MEPGEPVSARYETAYELGKRTGHTDTVVCADCGAFVMNVAAHDRFHSTLSEWQMQVTRTLVIDPEIELRRGPLRLRPGTTFPIPPGGAPDGT